MDQEQEYSEFMLKYFKSAQEFLDDFNKLNPKNKTKFQQELFIAMPEVANSLRSFLPLIF